MADNTCSVCLEPLLSKNGQTIGATVPCGHCFHADCFGGWQAAKGRKCKCPNCNVVTKSFVKIFISIPEAEDDDENDDISLNSTDSTAEDEKETSIEDSNDEEDNKTKTDEPGEDECNLDALAGAFQEDDDDDDDCQVIEERSTPAAASAPANMVDLTLSPSVNRAPCRQVSSDSDCTQTRRHSGNSSSRTTSAPSIDEDEQTLRLSKIAKRYKRRWKQLQSQLRDAVSQQNTLREQLGTAKEELDEVSSDLEHLQESQSDQNVALDGLKLQVVRLRDDKEFARRSLETSTKELESTRRQLKRLRDDYKKDLDRARADSMAEVKMLLEEHPKLVQENQRLKEALKRQQQQQRRDPERTTTTTAVGSSKVQRPRSKMDMAKALRQMDHVRQIKSSNHKNTDKKGGDSSARSSKSLDMSKYSAQTARLAAMATQRNNKSSSMWDNLASKQGNGPLRDALLRKPKSVGESALQRADSTTSSSSQSKSSSSSATPLHSKKRNSSAERSRGQTALTTHIHFGPKRRKFGSSISNHQQREFGS